MFSEVLLAAVKEIGFQKLWHSFSLLTDLMNSVLKFDWQLLFLS